MAEERLESNYEGLEFVGQENLFEGFLQGSEYQDQTWQQ